MSGKPVFDDDNPEWTETDFANALPASQLPPHIMAAFPRTRLAGDPSTLSGSIFGALITQGAGARLTRLAA